jgi:DNA invertase Pin-like site-specific DNA recombinase
VKSKKSVPASGLLIGYARVSTREQNLDLQLDALTKAGCFNIWQEKRSAASANRPQLDLAIRDLREGDTLVVWRLDRLARSMRELYRRLDAIYAAGAKFKSLQEQFDFSTATGKFILGILGLVAELERQITVERTIAGVKTAREQGKPFGAPRKMSDKQIAEAKALLKKPGWNVPRVAKKFGVSPPTIYNYVQGGKRKVTGSTAHAVKRRPKPKE